MAYSLSDLKKQNAQLMKMSSVHYDIEKPNLWPTKLICTANSPQLLLLHIPWSFAFVHDFFIIHIKCRIAQAPEESPNALLMEKVKQSSLVMYFFICSPNQPINI